MYRVIVAHPHQQHSYRLATALEKNDNLFLYITTVYNKPGSLTQKLLTVLKGDTKVKAKNRRCDNIPDNKVCQRAEILGLFYLLFMRIFKNDKRIMDPYNRFVSRIFGYFVAKEAIKNKVDAVICYDTECVTLFKILKKKAPDILRIMDVSAASRIYLKKIYERDMEILPEFAPRLRKEREELFTNKADSILNYFLSELENTDFFLVPSQFVVNSIDYSVTIDEEQILKCPYGVDHEMFLKKQKYDNHFPIKFIYVGGVKELKGIGYLLKAFSKIDKEKAVLTVVGTVDQGKDISSYVSNVHFTGTVLHSEIPDLLKKSDVFIFPSLGDSFSLSALEAAACGLPLIVSENTGMSDYMSGEEGFIIPIYSEKEISKTIHWFINNPSQIKKMGEKARLMAEHLTWDKYYHDVNMLIEGAINKNEKN